jgi:hypothetical protein
MERNDDRSNELQDPHSENTHWDPNCFSGDQESVEKVGIVCTLPHVHVGRFSFDDFPKHMRHKIHQHEHNKSNK